MYGEFFLPDFLFTVILAHTFWLCIRFNKYILYAKKQKKKSLIR